MRRASADIARIRRLNLAAKMREEEVTQAGEHRRLSHDAGQHPARQLALDSTQLALHFTKFAIEAALHFTELAIEPALHFAELAIEPALHFAELAIELALHFTE